MSLCLCPVGCLSLEKFSWESQQGRDRAMSGCNKNFQSGQSCSYIMRKVWYISSNLNSNLRRFHCTHPNLHTNVFLIDLLYVTLTILKKYLIRISHSSNTFEICWYTYIHTYLQNKQRSFRFIRTKQPIIFICFSFSFRFYWKNPNPFQRYWKHLIGLTIPLYMWRVNEAPYIY